MFGHRPRKFRLNKRNMSLQQSILGKSLEKKHCFDNRVTYYAYTVAQEQRSLQKSDSVVERSHIGLRFDKHLNNNNNNQGPCHSTKSNPKALSKDIKSSTISDVSIIKAFCKRHKNVTDRSCRNFGNHTTCTKQNLIPFLPYFLLMI